MKTGKLDVLYHERLVGTLADAGKGKTAFEYAEDWLENGFSISPFSLPLEKKVFVAEKDAFFGLFGVFADSLPDAWGQLLVNRMLQKRGIDTGKITALDRLSVVGNAGMGALTYRPCFPSESASEEMELDVLQAECRKILVSEESENLDTIFRLGGSSGGARPKILTTVEGEPWIIKFPAQHDPVNSGRMEVDYALCAKECGIEVPEVRLFASKTCSGYFGTKRFDRAEDKRIHMITASGLLEADFRAPCLDYHSLLKLTRIMTADDPVDLENMYLRMCFNVYAHNRDDHAKNFAYLYDEKRDRWHLSPAYDLTYSNTYFGEHTTSVDGNGKDPGKKELVAVGIGAGISRKKCEQMADKVQKITQEMLSGYLQINENPIR